MKYLLLIPILAFLSCNNPTHKAENITLDDDTYATRETDSVAVTQMVGTFFKAFDARDYDQMEAMMTPQTKLVHHNGVTTSAKEMLDIIKTTEPWYPRERKLSQYEYEGGEDWALVGVVNEATFLLPEGEELYAPYKETWFFQKTDGKWHLLRCHYSKITKETHTESVE
ncbi:nuclear transport factor 2 family protein [Mangrovimonas sp. CR14]|uniref:YybH family protein n=1 Tax=Mangrovimonas sp. CR14 TaxID=2706120 RepID=UPI001423681D|nr:nuclear transport factor 2 family protein [Mangrovimonas sp. CR14]NIK91772.1 nuclear transport factor 2 family protein [Mangrovimonas sp. CR14]